jgi:hypothetical protein
MLKVACGGHAFAESGLRPFQSARKRRGFSFRQPARHLAPWQKARLLPLAWIGGFRV